MKGSRPKVGLLFLTAEWFVQIGANQGSFSELKGRLNQDVVRIEEMLANHLDVTNSGVLATRDEVRVCVKQFEMDDVDGVVVCQITWGEDKLILEFLQRMPTLPILLWCYTPERHLSETLTMADLFRASGTVGSLQASGPLKRLGRQFSIAVGSDRNPETIRRIVAFGKAARTARGLKDLRIGLLPYRCDQMTGTYIDEFRLKKELGPEVKYISTYDYRLICDQVSPDRINTFIHELRSTCRVSDTLTEIGLARAARVSLGLLDVVKNYQLDAIAIEDVGEDLHRVVGLRPCLSVRELFENAVVSMESEIGGAVGLWVLRELTAQAPMFTEIFTFDEQENCLLMGHAGMHDLHLVDRTDEVVIEPDGEYLESEPDSAWMRFRAKGGPLTMLSVFCDTECFKFVISKGEALSGKQILLGSPHIYVKIEQPVVEFLEKSIRTGMTQHWIVVHEDTAEALLLLADILGLDTVVI